MDPVSGGRESITALILLQMELFTNGPSLNLTCPFWVSFPLLFVSYLVPFARLVLPSKHKVSKCVFALSSNVLPS